MEFELLQCAGIYACDCVVEDNTIWVGILILDPDHARPGEPHTLYDVINNQAQFPVILNADETPLYRHRLERIHE